MTVGVPTYILYHAVESVSICTMYTYTARSTVPPSPAAADSAIRGSVKASIIHRRDALKALKSPHRRFLELSTDEYLQ
ncbi:hypothetical protein F9C07_2284488 [Aspergillus flavus]|uniref:Uncharacterized protein n=1 Tax=Aspergillus flavus (strain ATCC 200026 / FGSC A1120 / IAM 13836 / NRRL 3357 / JCM 12722 / SRRC 167) TaxID=332952 RepID=A0A7U2MI91_ASPFN|nr:hypothetical protein F9C07_2284488 [Aspergillus flavus]